MKTAKLALVATAFQMKVSDLLLNNARDDQPAAAELVTAFSHSGSAPKPSAPGPGFWLHGSSTQLMGRVTRYSAAAFHVGFKACDGYGGDEQAAAAVAAAGLPSLFLLGKHDMMTPPPACRKRCPRRGRKCSTAAMP